MPTCGIKGIYLFVLVLRRVRACVGSEGCVSVLGCGVCTCVVCEACEHLNRVLRGVFTCVGSSVCTHFGF